MAEKTPWFSPAALDREHWRWRGMRRQKGGWDQALWVRVQDEWRRALHEE